MNTTAAYPSSAPTNWFRRAEAWLDAKGRGAWIAAMVLGFVFFWPVGLALVAYITITKRWSKDMFGQSCRSRRHHHGHSSDTSREWAREWGRSDRTAYRPSGNAAFDSYKADTLRRLEEEQEAFESFLQRLRQAKDKSEFDNFMDDRARKSQEATADADGEGTEAAKAARRGDETRKGEY